MLWKLIIFTFLCLFLTTSCDDDTSGDVKTTQIAAAVAQAGSSSDGNSGSASAAAVAKVTSVKTEKSSDPGSDRSANSNGGSYADGSSSEEDEDNDCNAEERDHDYDCTSALPRVKQAIIKIGFQRLNYFIENKFVNNNNYCGINQEHGQEGVIGSPLASWYISAMIALYTEKETLDELLSYTGLQNKDECRCMMKLIRRLNKSAYKGFYFYTGNIIADYKYNFTESYKRDVIEYLDGKAFNSNFSRPQMSARKENKIAAAKTGNVIVNVVSKQEASNIFNTDQQIVIVVGTYLKPFFKMSFNAANKTKGIYYGMYKPILTEYLYQEAIYKSMESRSLNSRLIEIPLTNKNSISLVIVPNTRCGLPFLVAKLTSDPQIFLDEIKYLQRTRIHLTIPVYKSITSEMNLVPVLQKTCEIERVFDISESQMIDSCGRSLNRSVTYIHLKSSAMFSLKGAEPYKQASANDCSDCGKPVDVCINYPAVFIYMINGVTVETIVGEVEEVESFTNE